MKKASQRGAFFVSAAARSAAWLLVALLSGLGWTTGAQGAACPTPRIDQWVVVSRVIDGDTLRLSDGRKLRLIGINTPELGRDGRPAEPLAQTARRALVDLLGDAPRLGLRFGREREDRYKRLLAHAYLPDGRNVEVSLLEQGLAAYIVVPPNTALSGCYRQAERLARDAGRGVWDSVYRPLPVDRVARDRGGFRIITGTVVRVGESRRSLWLNFQRSPGEGPREGVAVRISREDLGHFRQWDPRRLQGRRVTVRGWWRPYKKQLVTRLRHPAALEILR